MKHLFTLIIIIIFACLACSTAHHGMKAGEESASILVDSAYMLSKCQGKNILVYKYARPWSWWLVIAKDTCGYDVFHGSRHNDSIYLSKRKLKKSMIDWAFDTMPTESRQLYSEQGYTYWAAYTRLQVLDKNRNSICDLTDTIVYPKPEAVNFNKQTTRLAMMFLAVLFPENIPMPQ